jgi:hypothetical protein
MTSPEVQGCGRQNFKLTLYQIFPHNEPGPLDGEYKVLPCGHLTDSDDSGSYGILLCDDCVARLGFRTFR